MSTLATAAYKSEAASGYIVNTWFDRVFFIFAPLLALILAMIASGTPLADERFVMNGRRESWVSLFSGVFTMAHLFIVFFRSHANPVIFKQYPRRFILVPVLLFTAMLLSSWALVSVFVLAVWWDVYHSGLQTFGLGRLYDLRAGNPAEEVRALDRGLNLVLYIAPILAGASLMDHVIHFEKFGELGTVFLGTIPAKTALYRETFFWATVGIAVPYLVYYVYAVHRLSAKGYRMPRQKIILFVCTGLCSTMAWGFNSFGQAFFIMNFFHAWQYFALIGWSERDTLVRTFGFAGKRAAAYYAVLSLVLIAFSYGLWAKLWGESSHAAFSLLLTVSILHFWYDGFIWSVRKKQIQ